MIDTTVVVTCSHIADDGDEYCEATFEVARVGVPSDLVELVDQQLQLRGWTGRSMGGPVSCPRHRPGSAS